MSLFSELKRRKVLRVAGGYTVVAWVLIQVVDTIFPAFGLDDAAFRMLVIALAVGLIPTVILSWAFELTREGLLPERTAEADSTPAAGRSDRDALSITDVLRRPRFGIPLGIALLAALGTIAALSMQLLGSRAARLELLPQIESLVADGELDLAYSLALEAEQYLPNDPALARLWSRLAVTTSFVTEPGGAEVSYRRYTPFDSEWVSLGTTPLEAVRLPRAVLHWRFEKPGYDVAERSGESFDGTYRIELSERASPGAMAAIPASQRYFLLTGYVLDVFNVPPFHAARLEVSNEEYLEFVSNGGYENADYWSHLEFRRDGHEVSWQSAIDRFRDKTGRPGPATWEGGRYPEGSGLLPVTGISWFEAAAYARYRGMDLPSIYHWSSMTIFPAREEIALTSDDRLGFGLYRSEMAALSNLSGTGVAPIGSHKAVSPFGTFDAAGNVREWCWNATSDADDAQRYILGGSWKDPTYLYTYGVARSPWDRSEVNGVRLVSYTEGLEQVQHLRRPTPLPGKESLAPISDEVFAVYRDLYDYDNTGLNSVLESVHEDDSHWVRETVSFDATYDNERVLAHVYLPRNIEPPYQVVLYFTSSDAIYRMSSDDIESRFFDFIVKSGRAVVVPVLMGTYERNIGLDTTWPKNTREYSNHVVRWIQDFRRTADYLETRSDMDLGRLGFYGFSWGGWNGPIVLALDDRFVTGVFLSGGIPPTLARPEASSASFASRVTQPVLMISGKDDVIRPVATYQAPMFESLGTPAHLKRHAILDGGHLPPEDQIIRETLDWLDRYLGPVD